MSDTQVATIAGPPQATDRRPSLLELDGPREPSSLFMPGPRWAPTDPTRGGVSEESGVVMPAGRPGVPSPAAVADVQLPRPVGLSVGGPAPPKTNRPQPDPDVVALPYTGYSTGPGLTQVLGPVQVQEVDFVGDAITVVADPGREPYPSGPEFNDANANGVIEQDLGERALPTVIVRGHTPSVTAKLKASWQQWPLPPNDGTVHIRGQGSISIPDTIATVSGDYLILPATAAGSPVPDWVNSCPTAWMNWEVRGPGESVWRSAGTSSNRMYVTLDRPVGTVYHTVIATSTNAG